MNFLVTAKRYLPQDEFVWFSIIGICSCLIYFAYPQTVFLVVPITNLILSYVLNLSVYIKFLINYPSDTPVKVTTIIFERLIILAGNLLTIGILLFMLYHE